MNPFPDEWELLALFECEAIVLDPDIPWCYNTLTFDTQRGADRIYCQIAADWGDVQFRWWDHQGLRIQLDLHWVSGMSITTGGGRDAMTLTFRDAYLKPLEIQLRPTITCHWGTSNEQPS